MPNHHQPLSYMKQEAICLIKGSRCLLLHSTREGHIMLIFGGITSQVAIFLL